MLAIKSQSRSGDFRWAVANVYSPNEEADRSAFWDLLSSIRFQWSVRWCLGGDLNTFRFPHEKKGSMLLTRSMEKFFDFINATELVDLPLTRSKYTWSNNQERAAMTRIDRFLISTDGRSILQV